VTRSIHSIAVLLLIALCAAGCATTRAQIPEQEPSLIVPPVPPRTIEPPVVVEPPAEPPPVEPAPMPAPTNRPSRPRPPVDSSKPADTKQEPPPETVASVPVPPPVAPLRSAATPSGPEATRQIREILDNTQKTLDKIDAQSLSDDRKAHYTSAKAFIQQAEDALKKEELTQARLFAERAQNFARLLAGR
jgi:outer membrane biosynthesis protein TonB